MPYVAYDEHAKDGDGEAIGPHQADDGRSYVCPSCGGALTVVASHERGQSFVSRHFRHTSDGSGCSGESDAHKRMKSIAMSKAKQRWPAAEIGWETEAGQRRADVLVKFEETDDRLGEGVAIECQHRHEDKDIGSTNADYRHAGYSVLWLWESQFNGDDVDLAAGKLSVWWPTAVPGSEEWGEHPTAGDMLRLIRDAASPDAPAVPDKPVRYWEAPEVTLEIPIPATAERKAARWNLEVYHSRGLQKGGRHRTRIPDPSRWSETVWDSYQRPRGWTLEQQVPIPAAPDRKAEAWGLRAAWNRGNDAHQETRRKVLRIIRAQRPPAQADIIGPPRHLIRRLAPAEIQVSDVLEELAEQRDILLARDKVVRTTEPGLSHALRVEAGSEDPDRDLIAVLNLCRDRDDIPKTPRSQVAPGAPGAPDPSGGYLGGDA